MKEKVKQSKKIGTPYKDTVTFLKHKQFGLANIGISQKMSFDWRAAGIYLQEKKTKYRMKYSPIEYVWLLLVKELRELGLPIKSILNLKDFLLIPINIEDLLLSIKKDANLNDEYTELFGELIGVYEGSEEELKQDLKEVDQNIVDSMFTSMLVATLLKEEDYFFLIKKDGSCLIESQNEFERSTLQSLESFSNSSCIRIPLKMLVIEFLDKENITKYNLVDKPTPNPVQTLDFELTKGYDNMSPKVQVLITELMTEENLNEISYKTKDGKEVNISKVSQSK